MMVSVAVPAMLAAKASRKSGQVLQEQFGYNFIDLITKLAIFYVISFLIAKYMEAVIYFQGGLEHVATLFSIKFVKADQLPNKWVDLFVSPTVPGFEGGLLAESVTAQRLIDRGLNPEGWDRSYKFGSIEHQQAEPHLFKEGSDVKFKFWDLINAIAIFYISWEAYKYWERGGKDFLTLGIFGLLIAVLSVLSFSKFINRFSLNRFQEANK